MSPADRRPAYSVVVPVYNGAATLGACLAAIAHQTVPSADYEVIVVDDGSTDGSARIARAHGVTLLRQPHAGAAAARNRGAARARGDILVFTDADCEPAAGWLAAIVAPFHDPRVAGAKGAYRTRQRSLVARFTQAEYEEKYDRLARHARIDFVDTYAAAYRRDVFLAAGGFDPAFLLDEDQELSFRLAAAGHVLVFAPDAIVYHHHPPTLAAYVRRKFGLGFWKVRVHLRHPARALRDAYTPWTQKAQLALVPLAALLGLVAAAARAPATRRASRRLGAATAALTLLTTLPLVARARRQGRAVALAAPFLAVARALALDLGLLRGVAGLLARRRP
jgi:cellulose synthase/poly-beta-1,6-N-acetylglucosamine synthase-like glycosyltransferase